MAEVYTEDAIRDIRFLKAKKKKDIRRAKISRAIFFPVIMLLLYFLIQPQYTSWLYWLVLTGLIGFIFISGILEKVSHFDSEIQAKVQYYKEKIYNLAPWRKDLLEAINKEVNS